MEKWQTMIWAIRALAAVLVFSSGFSLQAAEAKRIAGKDTYERTIARMEILPSDIPHHHMVQQVTVFVTESDDPDFNSISVTTYEQVDGMKKGGTHKGYRIQHHENGDETYIRFEGSYKVSEKEEGVYESHFQGRWELTGGTGKFENIKGNGTYKSTEAKTGAVTEWTGKVEY